MRKGRAVRRPGGILAWLAAAGWLLAGFAGAAAGAGPGGCDAQGGEPVRVRAVNADWSLLLDDGRAVRLAGIDPVEAVAGGPDLGTQARARLAAWVVGRPAGLRPTGAGTDRWGRIEGLVFAGAETGPAAAGDPSPAPLSVALALVDAGLARARPEPAGPAACRTAILAAEGAARTAGLGLWKEPAYAILHPGEVGALDAALGTMVLVEGRIARIGRGRSRLFIQLGEKGGEVTASLANRDLFILDELGLNGARLIGTSLRVRGDLDARSGFSIDVSDAAAIEVLDRPGADAAARRGPDAAEGLGRWTR